MDGNGEEKTIKLEGHLHHTQKEIPDEELNAEIKRRFILN